MPGVLSKNGPYLAVGGGWYLLYALLRHRRTREAARQPLSLPLIGGSHLRTAFAVDMAIQAAAFLLATTLKTEKFYDFAGSLTYFTLFLYTLLAPKGGQKTVEPHPRQVLTTAMGIAWCSRLGTYLLTRVLLHGKDERFDKVKHMPARFAFFWFMQGLWVFLVGLPNWTLNSIPPSEQPPLGTQDKIGAAMWAAGFLIEVVADAQKFNFKLENPTGNMQTGLWKASRHVNYFGEVLLWAGNFVAASAGFVRPEQYVSAISPVFTYLLLTRLSGVPLLEASAAKKYGHLESFRKWKQETPLFFPKILG
ncbi:hypothetical protein DFJ74DRAFT_681125 [Hyaloraphidium curvatum]|nr:hypothetical protein DFJ74DRAFT_681125 [Hyaloraphidium curvatum]